MQIGDLVRIKKNSKPISRWIIEARDNNIPLLIIGERIEDREKAYAKRNNQAAVPLYEVLYKNTKWFIYPTLLERLSSADR
tara:strand:+ start:194 stop:436 length:243 start_codon:yes stop_codon:yes gene_type:complete